LLFEKLFQWVCKMYTLSINCNIVRCNVFCLTLELPVHLIVKLRTPAIKCCEESDYIDDDKNQWLRIEFSSEACSDIFSFFQKRVSESIGFVLLVRTYCLHLSTMISLICLVKDTFYSPSKRSNTYFSMWAVGYRRAKVSKSPSDVK
jgi:hypothetical protein